MSIKDPRNMTKAQLLEFAAHAQGRQDRYGPKEALKFHQFHDRTKMVTATYMCQGDEEMAVRGTTEGTAAPKRSKSRRRKETVPRANATTDLDAARNDDPATTMNATTELDAARNDDAATTMNAVTTLHAATNEHPVVNANAAVGTRDTHAATPLNAVTALHPATNAHAAMRARDTHAATVPPGLHNIDPALLPAQGGKSNNAFTPDPSLHRINATDMAILTSLGYPSIPAINGPNEGPPEYVVPSRALEIISNARSAPQADECDDSTAIRARGYRQTNTNIDAGPSSRRTGTAIEGRKKKTILNADARARKEAQALINKTGRSRSGQRRRR